MEMGNEREGGAPGMWVTAQEHVVQKGEWVAEEEEAE